MKKIGLGQTIQILANIGVIAGIAFLALEVHQNNQLLAADASFNRFNVERERRTRVMENHGELGEIIFKKRNGMPLNEFEVFQHSTMMEDVLESLKWQFEEVEADRLPRSSIDIASWRNVWRVNPELAVLVARRRADLDPAFVEFIERELSVDRQAE